MIDEHPYGDPSAGDGPEEPVRTGVARVDAVIDRVAGAADRPIDEHVAVFESAHDELRRTLDASPDDAEPAE
jgi:hypothetical protein